MAKINVVKLKNDAAKATNQQNYSKAIDLLKQIVQENPRDANTLNQIGFLYEKVSNTDAANKQYAKVAEFYTNDGFYLKAIACWKKVLKNDPGLHEAHLKLGDLYAKQGLSAEAKTMPGEAFDECVKRGRHREAGEVLRRMAELDPSDMKVRIRLAELYAREGQQEKAAGEYLALADELVKKGHRQEALQLEAARLGLAYTPEDPFGLLDLPFEKLQRLTSICNGPQTVNLAMILAALERRGVDAVECRHRVRVAVLVAQLKYAKSRLPQQRLEPLDLGPRLVAVFPRLA